MMRVGRLHSVADWLCHQHREFAGYHYAQAGVLGQQAEVGKQQPKILLILKKPAFDRSTFASSVVP